MSDFLTGQEEDGITDDVLLKLKGHVDKMMYLQEAIKLQEEQVANQKKAYNDISMVKIPELLGQYGLSEIRLESGEKVVVSEDLNATIKDPFMFHKWLRKRKEDDIIKTTFSFDRMQSQQYNKLVDAIEDAGIDYDSEDKVHAQTAKKYFKELTGYGDAKPKIAVADLPDWVKVFVFKKTKLAVKRKPKL